VRPSPRDSDARSQGGLPPPYVVDVGTLIVAAIAVGATAIFIWLL
jgi:hypothetical protein